MRHTQQVMLLLERTLSDLRDVETGQRGYVLTGDTVYLRPYYRALSSLHARLDSTRQLTVDNAAQRAQLPALSGLADRRVAILAEAIELRSQGDTGAAVAVIRSGHGLVVMDSIRTVVRALEG